MHYTILAALCATAFASAQNYYVPDPNAGAGTCNTIPLNQTSSLYQTIVDPGDLGNLPGVITGLGFAACGTGVHHYDTIEIVMDHIQTGVLSTTFAQNLTPNAQTVLQLTNHDWQVTQDTWNEIGLHTPFVFNGSDWVVIQITLTGHTWNSTTGSGAFHRDTRQRVYSNGWSTPPTTGSNSSAGVKLEVGVLTARASEYGRGCVGSNGLAPDASYTGQPMLGQTNSFDLQDAPASSLAFLVTGSNNRSPFPQDLSGLGAPGCYQYFGIDGSATAFTDSSGSATTSFTIPNNSSLLGAILYGQWACIDIPANPRGITTSDYIRVIAGN